jgi:hypothetical protein
LRIGEVEQAATNDLRELIKMKIYKLTESSDSSGLSGADPVSFGNFDEDTLSFLQTL